MVEYPDYWSPETVASFKKIEETVQNIIKLQKEVINQIEIDCLEIELMLKEIKK